MNQPVCQICGCVYVYRLGALTRTLAVNIQGAKSVCRSCFQAWLRENNLAEPPTCSICKRYFRVDLYDYFLQPVFDCRRCAESFCDECVNDSICVDGTKTHDFP